MSRVEKTISALAYAIALERAGEEKNPREFAYPYNDVARFLDFEIAHSPDYLRLAVRAATFLFDLSGFYYSGASFHCLEPNERIKQVRAWRQSSWNVCREFIRFYETLSLLALYSR